MLTFTGNAAGPTGSIEFSDDGVNWTFCRGATSVTCYAAAAVLDDWEAPADNPTVSRPSVDGVSDLVLRVCHRQLFPVITTFAGRPYRGNQDRHPRPPRDSEHALPAAAHRHQGLGNTFATIVADVVGLEDGAATIWTMSASDETALLALLNLPQTTLLLQSPDNRQWYLRINSARPTDIPYLVGPGSYRSHAIVWRGQPRP